jgi:hypothetical protein
MRSHAIAAALLSLLALPRPATAQLMASEPGSVSQTVDGTTITVKYSRPRARGRTNLFGSRVRWGEVWTPGANAATTLQVSKDVTIGGKALPAGKYSVWVVVEPGAWEMVLDRDTALFHSQGPKHRPGQVRFAVQRTRRPFMEVLTWWFAEVDAKGTTLAFQWDTVYVPVRINVPASYITAVAPDVAKRLAGTYRLELEPEPVSTDTSLHAPTETNARQIRFTIRQQGNELRGEMDPPMYRTEDGYKDWVVLPKGNAGWFYLGRVHNGEIVEMFDFFQMHFDAAGGTARSFEIRAPNDQLIGKGTRLP